MFDPEEEGDELVFEGAFILEDVNTGAWIAAVTYISDVVIYDDNNNS